MLWNLILHHYKHQIYLKVYLHVREHIGLMHNLFQSLMLHPIQIQYVFQGINGQYNILKDANKGLNNSFFYGFASELDAKEYLIGIYTTHINEQVNTACNSGIGFKYSYYDPDTNSMTEKCFIDEMMVNQYPILKETGVEYIELRGVNGENIFEYKDAEPYLYGMAGIRAADTDALIKNLTVEKI